MLISIWNEIFVQIEFRLHFLRVLWIVMDAVRVKGGNGEYRARFVVISSEFWRLLSLNIDFLVIETLWRLGSDALSIVYRFHLLLKLLVIKNSFILILAILLLFLLLFFLLVVSTILLLLQFLLRQLFLLLHYGLLYFNKLLKPLFNDAWIIKVFTFDGFQFLLIRNDVVVKLGTFCAFDLFHDVFVC